MSMCNPEGDGDPAVNGDLIVVDHTCTDVSQIPDNWISEVREMVVHSAGESHAGQIYHGLGLLYEVDSRFSYEIVKSLDSPDPDKLTIMGGQRNASNTEWVEGYVGEQDYWATATARQRTGNTAQHSVDMGHPFTASLWFWCSTDIGKADGCCNEDEIYITFNDERRDAYFSAINNFNQNYTQTTFVYITSVTDVGADQNGWRVTRYNEDIRNKANQVKGVLFDQADMENWNLANTEQRTDTWDGHTLYLRHSDYDEGNEPDTNDGDHTNDALCLRKAKAFWWLLARIAGWPGK